MLLQILIPTFNRVDLLVNHLNVILAGITQYNLQKKISLIIIDNKSTDNTVPKVEKLILKAKKQNVRISLHKNQKNIGVSRSYCKLISLSTAEYIWIQSDDDIYYKSSFYDVVKAIESSKPDMILIPTSIQDMSNIKNLELGGHSCLEHLSDRSIKSVDKCLGFFGSVISKNNIMSKSVSICENENIRIDNNYLCKIICYFLFSII